jgi:hypothetical protein
MPLVAFALCASAARGETSKTLDAMQVTKANRDVERSRRSMEKEFVM